MDILNLSRLLRVEDMIAPLPDCTVSALSFFAIKLAFYYNELQSPSNKSSQFQNELSTPRIVRQS